MSMRRLLFDLVVAIMWTGLGLVLFLAWFIGTFVLCGFIGGGAIVALLTTLRLIRRREV